MLKKTLLIAATMLACAFGSAQAADTMKGVNQNGFTESVGFDFIASAKHAGGVTSYRTTYSADVYTVSDATAGQFNKWLQHIGVNAAPSSFNSWTYNAAKAKISCQAASSVVYTPGRVSTETLQDNCALAHSQ